MKNLIFALLVMACIAFSKDVKAADCCGELVVSNCRDFDKNEGCLNRPSNGVSWILMKVDTKHMPEIEFTNWKVVLTYNDGTNDNYVTRYKHQFGYIPEEEVYALWAWIYIPYGAPNCTFAIHLHDEDGYLLHTHLPAYLYDVGFPICGGNYKLSNSMNENFDEYKIYPNPVVRDFTVEYQAIQNEETALEIFDINGNSIYIRQFEHKNSGLHSKQINNLNLTKGIYFCRIKTAESEKTIKITKL